MYTVFLVNTFPNDSFSTVNKILLRFNKSKSFCITEPVQCNFNYLFHIVSLLFTMQNLIYFSVTLLFRTCTPNVDSVLYCTECSDSLLIFRNFSNEILAIFLPFIVHQYHELADNVIEHLIIP